MAVTFDAVGPSAAGASATNVATASWTHTVAAGPCAVTAGCGISTDASTITATCGGTSMTSLGKVHNNNSTSGFTQLFGLANVSTGAKTIQLSGGGGTDFVAGSQSYAGADTATPFGTGVTSFGGPSATTSSVVVTGTTAGNMVAGACSFGAATIAAGAGSTSRWVINAFTSSAAGNACGVDKAGGGSVTLNWTCTTGDWCGAVGVEVKAAAGGGAAAGPGVLAQPGGAVWRRRYRRDQQPFPQVYQTPAQTVTAGLATAAGTAALPQFGAYITGLAGSGLSWFVTGQGTPKLLIAENPWGLIPNAGRWTGTYQTTIDNYCNSRGGQGYSAIYTDPLGNTENGGAFADGRTYDGVFPFTVNGTPATTAGVSSGATIGLNATFWARVDYLIAGCARNNMVAMLNVGYDGGNTSDYGTGAALTSLTATQHQAYGAALAARYAATPNIIWVVGNDYFGTTDTEYSSILTGLRGGGDTHVITIHNNAETTSRRDFGTGSGNAAMAWGLANTQVNFVYEYAQTYFGVEYALAESSPITTIWGDGYFYSNSGTNADRAMRQFFWWALASGAVGCSTGDERIWQWDTNAAASVTTGAWYTAQVAVIRATIEPLPNWYNLQAAPGSGFITAGRGTRFGGTTSGGGGTAYGEAATDNYIAASLCADKSLAVIYFSAGTAASTITIDQTKLATGYTATWVDPASGAQTSGTPGATYANHGTNSVGARDWVLILQAPPATSVNAGLASGAGTAQGNDPAIGVNAAAATEVGAALSPSAVSAASVTATPATGTGAALNPAAAIGVNAVLASGAGAALNATASTTTAGTATATIASGTGAALNGAAAIGVNAAPATEVGAALSPAVTTAASPPVTAAAGTGTALNPAAAAAAAPAAVLATGTGAALNPAVAITVPAGLATGAGTALNATASTTTAGTGTATAATGTGTALGATIAIAVTATLASGAGAALNASASTASAGTANAAAATGTGTAQGATAAITVTVTGASGTGAALGAAAVSVASPATTAATGTGAALNPAAAVGVNTALAAGTGTAQGATVTATASPAAVLATGAGTALNATASTTTAGTANAVLATGTGTAASATPAIGAVATLAAGAGTALNATVSTAAFTNAQAGLATGTGTARQPSLTLTSNATAAPATGAGTTAAVPGAGVNAAAASGAGTARNATGQIGWVAAAGVAAGTGTAQSPVAVLVATAQAAAAAGLGAALRATAKTVTYGTARQAALAMAGAVAGQQAIPHAGDGQMTLPRAEGGTYP